MVHLLAPSLRQSIRDPLAVWCNPFAITEDPHRTLRDYTYHAIVKPGFSVAVAVENQLREMASGGKNLLRIVQDMHAVWVTRKQFLWFGAASDF